MSELRKLVEVYERAAHTTGMNGEGGATLFIDPEAGVKAIVAHLQESIGHYIERAEKAETEVAWLVTQVSGLRDREAELLAEVDRWRNNSDNSQLQVGDLEAQTVSMQRWIDHHNQRADKAERILEEGVRMAAAMNMTAGWVDSAKQILGGKS